MTLLVAVKVPAERLNEKRRPIMFPKSGIILVADTRFTFLKSPGKCPIDDAQKLFRLSNNVIAGYAGAAGIAEPALKCAELAIQQHKWSDPAKIALAVKQYLRYWTSQSVVPKEHSIGTVVLLGIAAEKRRHVLFELNRQNGFEFQQRDGIVSKGTGAKEFEYAFSREIDTGTAGWSASVRSGYRVGRRDNEMVLVKRDPSEKDSVPIFEVAGFVVSLANNVIEKAGVADVGGQTQNYYLTAKGVRAVAASRLPAGGPPWVKITPERVSSWAEIQDLHYQCPPMDAECRLFL